MEIFNYNENFKDRIRKLRNESTYAEVLLWQHIKNKQLLGVQFLRQKPVNNYILDFYAKRPRLAIEIDGSSHDLKLEYDEFRQKELELLGITFIRFSNQEVLENLDSVLREIKRVLTSIPTSI